MDNVAGPVPCESRPYRRQKCAAGGEKRRPGRPTVNHPKKEDMYLFSQNCVSPDMDPSLFQHLDCEGQCWILLAEERNAPPRFKFQNSQLHNYKTVKQIGERVLDLIDKDFGFVRRNTLFFCGLMRAPSPCPKCESGRSACQRILISTKPSGEDMFVYHRCVGCLISIHGKRAKQVPLKDCCCKSLDLSSLREKMTSLRRQRRTRGHRSVKRAPEYQEDGEDSSSSSPPQQKRQKSDPCPTQACESADLGSITQPMYCVKEENERPPPRPEAMLFGQSFMMGMAGMGEVPDGFSGTLQATTTAPLVPAVTGELMGETRGNIPSKEEFLAGTLSSPWQSSVASSPGLHSDLDSMGDEDYHLPNGFGYEQGFHKYGSGDTLVGDFVSMLHQWDSPVRVCKVGRERPMSFLSEIMGGP